MEKVCNRCENKCGGTKKISYAAHKIITTKKERTIKWLLGIVAVLVILFIGSNIGWNLHHRSHCEHMSGVHLFENN